MAEATRKKKIAILGGGMGGLTAAYELSERAEYDITVYQLGWRLGGQGSSGRNLRSADRIEEHGLHVWFGFYDNAFSLMRRCYATLDRPKSDPLASVDQAFKPVDHLTMEELRNGKWLPWLVEFPTNNFKPGVGGELFTIWGAIILILKWAAAFYEKWPDEFFGKYGWLKQIIKWILQWIARLFKLSQAGALPQTGEPPDLPDWVRAALARVESRTEVQPDRAEAWLLHQAVKFAESLPPDHTLHSEVDHNVLVWLIQRFVNNTWDRLKPTVLTDDEARRSWILMYLGATCFSGLIIDKCFSRGFDRLDKYDLMDWFYSHKLVDDPLANDIAIHSAPMQSFYDLIFHYEAGDTNKPRLAAGIALVLLLRMVYGYKGSIMWYMQSAMGDTIFTPIYEVLKHRGVKFKFFHRVTHLGLSKDKHKVETVTISRQVNLKVGEYDPLVLIKGQLCWPSEPLYDQIVEGETLKDNRINLEQSLGWTLWKDTGGEITLEAGVDFDQVILAIGLGALAPICTELVEANPKWQAMFSHIKTVQTQAIQLWFQPDSKELGVDPPVLGIGGYVHPHSSLTDFSHLVARENWPAPKGPRYIVYACGVLSEQPDETQEKADRRVKQIALDFLKNAAGPLWPKATDPLNPAGLNWEKLVAPDRLKGESRFDAQYWRANVDPIERYVLSLPDTNQYRLKASESGFGNLILTGNWINTGFNIGCIESAVMSGMQAARVLMGEPTYIVGERLL